MRRALLILLLGLGLLAAGCGNSSGNSAATSTETTTDTSTETTTETTPTDGCADVDVLPAREDGSAKAPQERLDP